jgi:hypothetical protein
VSTWFPIGPDFVYAPRDTAVPKRLSRRNEWARQAKVTSMAVDGSSTPPTLYTIERPYPQPDSNYQPQLPYWPPSGAAFRSQDDGRTWKSIADGLIASSPGLIPSSVAVHPLLPTYIYLGTVSGEVHVSNSRGDSWQSFQSLGAGVTQIVVDPRGAGTPTTTTIYAATTSGLRRSTDGGASWQSTPLTGDVMCLAFNMPALGAADLYAGVRGVGLFHASDAAGTWTNLSGSGSGLPAQAGNNFSGVLVDFCRLNPSRVYVVLGPFGGSISLYTSPSGPTGFVAVASASAPPSDLYRFAFAVAPNSSGGATDVLLFSGVALYRSNNGGASWDVCGDDPHGDHNAFGFSTLAPAPGQIPAVYVGSDGGLFASTSLAKGAAAVIGYPSDFSDGSMYTASGVAQNYNHGKTSLALSAYAADPASAARGYSAGQDTGLAGHTGTLGWRGLDDSTDAWGVAVAPGADGLKVWYRTPFDTRLMTDHGETSPALVLVSTGAPQSGGSATSTMRVDASGRCLTGIYPTTLLQSAVNPGTNQVVTPISMLGVVPGVWVLIDNEVVVVSAPVTATTFTANLVSPHAANAAVKVFGGVIVGIDQSGSATQVSQALALDIPKAMATHPTDDRFAVCVTGKQQSNPDQRVWMTNGAPLGASTVWNEIAGPTKPTGGLLSSAAIDANGKVYVLLTDLTWTAPGGAPVTTPLYEVSTGSWVAQACSGLPSGPFGSIVVPPGATDTLYITSGSQAYEVKRAGGKWNWTAVGSGLPGQPLVDLWVGDVGAGGTPKLLLRASVVSRGVWEADVTAGPATPDPATRPYLRHQPLDQGWLSPSIEGQVDPFAPAAGPSLYHWESPDIKIDARRPGTGSGPYYQNDPENPLPLSHVAFDQFLDNSQNLPQSDQANVHVQVHNRSYAALNAVSVWAIWCRPAGGVPSLAASPSMGNAYDFWGQFHPDGSIHPGLPMDSPWKPVGPPISVSSLDASHPQIATFPNWMVPTLAPGDNGHYCITAFVHSQANPINETNMSVDAIATSNPQVAQKNLHITTMLPMGFDFGGYGLRECLEFHLADGEDSIVDLVFDFSELPKGLRAAVQLTRLETEIPLAKAITGVARRYAAEGNGRAPSGVRWLRQWADRLEDATKREHRDPDRDDFWLVPRFAPHIYAAKPAGTLAVNGVRMKSNQRAAAILAITGLSRKALTQDYRFRVVQRVAGRVVGGSTYWIQRAEDEKPGGTTRPAPILEPPFPLPDRF